MFPFTENDQNVCVAQQVFFHIFRAKFWFPDKITKKFASLKIFCDIPVLVKNP